MKVSIKNIGALDQAEFELGDLTVLCGRNNTGKTYATYALFGFLSFWKEAFYVEVPSAAIQRLHSQGTVVLNANDYLQQTDSIMSKACTEYRKLLPRVFASSRDRFANSVFSVAIAAETRIAATTYEQTMGTSQSQLLSISKKQSSPEVTVSLLAPKQKLSMPRELLSRVVGEAMRDICFGSVLPNPFIASAERTGAAIFRKELDLARNRLLEHLSSNKKKFDPLDLLTKASLSYALPVTRNVDFTRRLEDLAKQHSFVSDKHPDILEDFSGIIGGKYVVNKDDELFYSPTGKRLNLTMAESSSAVRSLLDVGFYLRHVAQQNDLLMIDEPELNLHPENQRKIARLLARLVNVGIKVFVTTHSDYIIKELNTLIMLNCEGTAQKRVRRNYGYTGTDRLSADRIRVYIANRRSVRTENGGKKRTIQTLSPADVDPVLGIEAATFDQTIDEMNLIQESLLCDLEP